MKYGKSGKAQKCSRTWKNLVLRHHDEILEKPNTYPSSEVIKFICDITNVFSIYQNKRVDFIGN